MPSNCNFMVVTYCLVAIAAAIVIDSTLGLIYCKKSYQNTKTSYCSFYQKTVGYLFTSVVFISCLMVKYININELIRKIADAEDKFFFFCNFIVI